MVSAAAREGIPILFMTIPEHFFGSNKLRQKHYSCMYNFAGVSIEQSCGSPESKKCLGIAIQDQWDSTLRPDSILGDQIGGKISECLENN